jgi:anti-sigma-K factor RskA
MTAPIPDDVRDLAAGYALGALSPEETSAFEAALARSPELQREVAAYREVNALLATRDGAAAPAALRGRLLARIREEKVAPLAAAPRRRGGWMAVALAASVVLAVALGLRGRQLATTVRAQDSTIARLDSLLAAQGATLADRERTLRTLLDAEGDLALAHLTATGEQPPGIQLFWNRRANTAVLHAFRLPPVPEGRVYQLWLMRDGRPVPSETFSPGAGGGSLVLPFAVPGGGFSAAAVTIEPAGGSPAPTSAVLLFGTISQGS